MPSSLDRLVYIDDSGHPTSGLVVFGWVEFTPQNWGPVLRTWLETRKRLWSKYGIPVTQELHMTEYAHGRGRISKKVPARYCHDGIEYWKDFGADVAREVLETMRCSEGLRTGAVYRRGEPTNIASTKAQTYAALVARFEAELAQSDSLALLFMDGDGHDHTYRTAHRNLSLDNRRVIEDAIHLDSKDSQLVQMADHVAWCANACIERPQRSEFAHEWYAAYLAERDPARRPEPI